MKSTYTGILFMFVGLLHIHVSAQPDENLNVPATLPYLIENNEIFNSYTETPDSIIEDELFEKKHYPRVATMYSAVLPGLGQIYNRQIWKVPFIYGGFVAFGYGVNWNHTRYLNYKKAYYHLNDNDPSTTFYTQIKGLEEVDEFSAPANLNERLLQSIESFSRQRNRLIIGTAAFYLLNVLDANVNAHFLDFDISEDLTLNIQQVTTHPFTGTPVFGAILTYNF